jgi:hypothetical protein
VKNGIVAAYDPFVMSRKILSIPRRENFREKTRGGCKREIISPFISR